MQKYTIKNYCILPSLLLPEEAAAFPHNFRENLSVFSLTMFYIIFHYRNNIYIYNYICNIFRYIIIILLYFIQICKSMFGKIPMND